MQSKPAEVTQAVPFGLSWFMPALHAQMKAQLAGGPGRGPLAMRPELQAGSKRPCWARSAGRGHPWPDEGAD